MKAKKRKLKTAQAQTDSAWIHSSLTVFVFPSLTEYVVCALASTAFQNIQSSYAICN